MSRAILKARSRAVREHSRHDKAAAAPAERSCRLRRQGRGSPPEVEAPAAEQQDQDDDEEFKSAQTHQR
jgi:hypothetical protein